MNLTTTYKSIQVQHLGLFRGSVLIALITLSLIGLIYYSASGTCSFLDVAFTNKLRSPFFWNAFRLPIHMDHLHKQTTHCVDSDYQSDCLCYVSERSIGYKNQELLYIQHLIILI